MPVEVGEIPPKFSRRGLDPVFATCHVGKVWKLVRGVDFEGITLNAVALAAKRYAASNGLRASAVTRVPDSVFVIFEVDEECET